MEAKSEVGGSDESEREGRGANDKAQSQREEKKGGNRGEKRTLFSVSRWAA